MAIDLLLFGRGATSSARGLCWVSTQLAATISVQSVRMATGLLLLEALRDDQRSWPLLKMLPSDALGRMYSCSRSKGRPWQNVQL